MNRNNGAAVAADEIFAESGLCSSWCSKLVFAGGAALPVCSLQVTAWPMVQVPRDPSRECDHTAHAASCCI